MCAVVREFTNEIEATVRISRPTRVGAHNVFTGQWND